jgi:hypothetical protein
MTLFKNGADMSEADILYAIKFADRISVSARHGAQTPDEVIIGEGSSTLIFWRQRQAISKSRFAGWSAAWFNTYGNVSGLTPAMTPAVALKLEQMLWSKVQS